jgi:O-antigen/teichoic acid export membrane protein
MEMLISSFFAMLLRAITLGSKFLLVIYIAKELEPKDIATYTLFVSVLVFSVYLLGLEFHNYLAREVLGKEVSDWSLYVRDSIVFSIISYFVFFPIIFLVFILDILPSEYRWLFFVVLLMEYFSQECYRLLIIMEKLVQANLILFIRSGLWCYMAIWLMSVSEEARVIETLLWLWAIGGFLSIIVCIKLIVKSGVKWKSWLSGGIDFSWIRNGLSVGGFILIGTLAYRGVYTFDKILIKTFTEYEVIAIYGLFLTIVGVAQSFIEAGVVSYYFPKLVSAHNQKQNKKFIHESKNMMKFVIIFSIIACLFMVVLINPVLTYIDRVIYIENIDIFWVIIGVFFIWSISITPRYILFSLKHDRIYVAAQIITFSLALIFYILLIPKFSGLGASISLFIATISSSVFLFYHSYKELKKIQIE